MANRLKGDVEITLDGKSWTLRPSFNAILKIEEQLGLGMFEIMVAGGQSRLGIGQIARIFHICMSEVHGNDTPEFEDVGRHLVEAGVSNFYDKITTLLANSVTGGHTSKNAGAPAAGKKKSTGGAS